MSRDAVAPAPRAKRPAGTVARRALTIAWGLPVVAACVWTGGWALGAAAGALAFAGLREWWPLGAALGVRTLRPAPEVWVGAAALIAGAVAGPVAFAWALPVALSLTAGGGLVRALWNRRPVGAGGILARTAWAVTGLLYIPWLLGYALLLRGSGPHGLAKLAFVMAAVWSADVGAFLVGGTLGRRQLAPGISPGKTVEGAVAALALGTAAAAAAAAIPWFRVNEPLAAVAGFALAGIGLLGDLWESLLKRGAGVKDSGATLPGHGGVLDRFDSLLFALPAAYWLLASAPVHPRPL